MIATATTTQDVGWKTKALESINRPLPADIGREELEAVSHLEESGPGRLTAEVDILKKVVLYQFEDKDRDQAKTAQVTREDVEPGEETEKIENATQGQPEAAKAKPDSMGADASPSDTGSSNEGQKDGKKMLTRSQARKLIWEGKELPSGWTVSSKNHPIPPGWKEDWIGNIFPGENAEYGEDFPEGHYINLVGLRISGAPPTKESRKEDVERLKSEIKRKKVLARELGKNLNKLSPEKKAAVEKQISELKAEIEQQEKDLGVMEEVWRNTPPDEIVDEEQPWVRKIYANTTGYLVQNSEGDYQFTNETNTGRVLREMGISNKPDTATTSPLDRVFNILHDRYHVDHYLALAGHPPGLLDIPGKRVLITKGPKLIKPVKGVFPTMEEFINGLLRDQAIYMHCWNHLAVTPLYNRKIERGLALILAGPRNSGKSVCQNFIITPLLGGRVARPYAYMVGDTTFNGDWFESEHLMLEDETPPNNYDKQQRIAAGIKTLVANEIQWCHGKGDKALTLTPFWRVSISVNNNSANLRAVPANDETLDDKLLILETYPEATVRLVEKLGSQEAFRNKLREELPAYLYHLRYEFQIPEDLKDTRFGMKPFRNPDIVKAVKESAPYVHLLEYMRTKLYSGVKGLFKSTSEIHQDLKDVGAPSGLAPTATHILGEYLTSIAGMGTGEVTPKRTSKANGYVLNFAAIGPEP